jgi:hypothetical protein
MRLRRVAGYPDGTGRSIYQCPKCKSIYVGRDPMYCQEPGCQDDQNK